MAAILGGGLGGLSTGYYLVKHNITGNNNLKLFLLEATEHYGGWIKSIRTKDYTFEQGPRTIRPKGVRGFNTLNMIEDLGLSDHVHPIKPQHPAAKIRMIYANNSLHILPSSLLGVFRKNQPFTKPLIYALFNDIKSSSTNKLEDDSIYNFVERRFGKEIADFAISPMICGICAGDAKEISVKFLMKTLFDYEQNHGGVLKGMMKTMFKSKGSKDDELELSFLAKKAKEEMWSVYSLKGGLDIFPKTLSRYLKDNNVQVNMNTKVEEIEFADSSSVTLKTSTGVNLDVNHVYSSLPAHALAKLVMKQHPLLAKALNDIPFVTVGIVNLYYSGPDLLIEPAFGFLVPPIEKSPILGVIFDSCCLPDQNGTVLTVMLGGKWYRERFGYTTTKADLLHIAIDEVKTILQIKQKPSASNVNILHDCIPQYVVGHYENVEKIRKYVDENNLPLSLIGCSYDGVGINDVIYSARSQVEKDCT